MGTKRNDFLHTVYKKSIRLNVLQNKRSKF